MTAKTNKKLATEMGNNDKNTKGISGNNHRNKVQNNTVTKMSLT